MFESEVHTIGKKVKNIYNTNNKIPNTRNVVYAIVIDILRSFSGGGARKDDGPAKTGAISKERRQQGDSFQVHVKRRKKTQTGRLVD